MIHPASGTQKIEHHWSKLHKTPVGVVSSALYLVGTKEEIW